MEITVFMAYEFMRDVRGSFCGNCNLEDIGMYTTDEIARELRIASHKAYAYLMKALECGYVKYSKGRWFV